MNTRHTRPEFEIASCETSIRWLLGEETPNRALIAKHKLQIRVLKEQINGQNLNLERDDHGFFVMPGEREVA